MNLKYYKLSISQFDKDIKKISSLKGVKIVEIEVNALKDIKINQSIQNKIKTLI